MSIERSKCPGRARSFGPWWSKYMFALWFLVVVVIGMASFWPTSGNSRLHCSLMVTSSSSSSRVWLARTTKSIHHKWIWDLPASWALFKNHILLIISCHWRTNRTRTKHGSKTYTISSTLWTWFSTSGSYSLYILVAQNDIPAPIVNYDSVVMLLFYTNHRFVNDTVISLLRKLSRGFDSGLPKVRWKKYDLPGTLRTYVWKCRILRQGTLLWMWFWDDHYLSAAITIFSQ